MGISSPFYSGLYLTYELPSCILIKCIVLPVFFLRIFYLHHCLSMLLSAWNTVITPFSNCLEIIKQIYFNLFGILFSITLVPN